MPGAKAASSVTVEPRRNTRDYCSRMDGPRVRLDWHLHGGLPGFLGAQAGPGSRQDEQHFAEDPAGRHGVPHERVQAARHLHGDRRHRHGRGAVAHHGARVRHRRRPVGRRGLRRHARGHARQHPHGPRRRGVGGQGAQHQLQVRPDHGPVRGVVRASGPVAVAHRHGVRHGCGRGHQRRAGRPHAHEHRHGRGLRHRRFRRGAVRPCGRRHLHEGGRRGRRPRGQGRSGHSRGRSAQPGHHRRQRGRQRGRRRGHGRRPVRELHGRHPGPHHPGGHLRRAGRLLRHGRPGVGARDPGHHRRLRHHHVHHRPVRRACQGRRRAAQGLEPRHLRRGRHRDRRDLLPVLRVEHAVRRRAAAVAVRLGAVRPGGGPRHRQDHRVLLLRQVQAGA